MRDLVAFGKYGVVIGGSLLAGSVIAGLWYAVKFAALPDVPEKRENALPELNMAVADDFEFDVSVFRKTQSDVSVLTGRLAKRFRLAGTFLAVGPSEHSRRAVIDFLVSQEQKLVSEGEILEDGIVVASIFQDRIVLRDGSETEDIRLGFSDVATTHEGASLSGEGNQGKGLARFGKKVGETRWALSREAVLDYYKELLNDTSRLAYVFDSMRPVYDGDTIRGYLLDVQGEDEIFNAFGLQEGDVITTVNSIPMSSRYRAEYLIREFVADRANIFVLDIERAGKKEKYIYMIR